MTYSINVHPESTEDIVSVRKTLQQVTAQASKLLHQLNPDVKKLEVMCSQWLCYSEVLLLLRSCSVCFQEVINQLMSLEAVIARARSLKAKFGIAGAEKDDCEELERWTLLFHTTLTLLLCFTAPALKFTVLMLLKPYPASV